MSYPADRIVITHLPDGGSDLIITNWNEVIATFAAKTASDKDEAQDVVVIDEERKEKLREVFWDMNELSSQLNFLMSFLSLKRAKCSLLPHLKDVVFFIVESYGKLQLCCHIYKN